MIQIVAIVVVTNGGVLRILRVFTEIVRRARVVLAAVVDHREVWSDVAGDRGRRGDELNVVHRIVQTSAGRPVCVIELSGRLARIVRVEIERR